jgi:hypothetical protein
MASIPNYFKPQLTIQQILAITETAPVSRINAVVVAPQYRLSRYQIEDQTYSVTYAGATATEVEYKYYEGDVLTDIPATDIVDLDSIKVFLANAEAQLFSIAAVDNDFYVDNLADASLLRCAGGDLVRLSGAAGGDLLTELLGRNLKVGDKLTNLDANITREVIGFYGVTIPADYGSDGADNSIGTSAFNPVATTTNVLTNATTAHADVSELPGSYDITKTGDFEGFEQGSLVDGKFGEEFVITVNTPGAPGTATVNINTVSGRFSATNVATTDTAGDYEITDAALAGLTVTLAINAGNALAANDRVVFKAFGDYEPLVGGTEVIAADSGNGYFGPKDTTYVIEVTNGLTAADVVANGADGAVVRITDTAGIDTIQTGVVVTEDAVFNVGSYGLRTSFNLSAYAGVSGLRKGDKFFIVAKAATLDTKRFDKVRLSGPIVDTATFTNPATAIGIRAVEPFSGALVLDDPVNFSTATPFTVTSDGVTVVSGLGVETGQSTKSTLRSAIGTVEVSFRSVIAPTSTESFFKVNATNVQSLTGIDDIENDLGFACAEALRGSQGKDIYAVRVGGTNAAAFTAALKKLENSDLTYALAIISDDEAAQRAAQTHVDKMSSADRKQFRRAYAAVESPGEWARLKQRADTTTYSATVTDSGGANILVTVADNDVDLTTLSINAGDLVKFPGEDATYEIASVISASELLLTSGPASAISPASVFEIWAADTTTSQVEYIVARSNSFSSRRFINIWCEGGTKNINGISTSVPVRFLAAHIAGLRSAVVPQQGLTRTEVTTLTAASAMHVRYSQEELNEIAAAGTYVVTQNSEGAPVYIRHQLTTEVSEGSLSYEDSVGVNLDDLAFQFKDALEDEIGKRNVVPGTISELRAVIVNILDNATQAETAGLGLGLGPQIIRWEDLVVEADPILKDRIKITVTVIMPLPLNNIEVVLNANVDVTL